MVMMMVVVRDPALGSWKQKPICIELPVVGSVNNRLLHHFKGQATMATPRNSPMLKSMCAGPGGTEFKAQFCNQGQVASCV